MLSQPLVALDIGSTKVACVIATPHEQPPGFEIMGSSLATYPAGTDTWPHDALIIGRTIEQALDATGVGADFVDAHVAMSHPSLQSETVRSSVVLADEPVVVRDHDLQRLSRAAFDQVLGVDRDALVMEPLGYSGNGFQGVRDPLGLSATRLFGTFHIVTVPMAVRRTVVQAVESAGLEVARLTHSLEANAAACEDTEGPERLLLIDLGGLHSDVGLFVDGRLRASQTVASGGLTLAFAVAKELQLTLDQATTLSLEGLASHRIEVRQHIKRWFVDLQQAVRKVLSDEPLADRAVVTGRGALIDGVVEWIERATKIKTSISRSPRIDATGNLSLQVGLSTAVGLMALATAATPSPFSDPTGLFDRLITRTKTLLTEYF